ncbi:hypothetical protein C5C41_06120 [Rathayibacter sp. AY1E9]|uniref:hypothetical protein n=1 Tax=unclassified Rathayibacter TaxID=2609250 RepID=UPI000CE90631|nr:MULTISPECIES: hypothetical protein [unclassified Rathayibacter]PPG53584.1 hypothetical protein C5C41_06120 [Rathayibacter sp. AY1E9]PPG56592.1 hypothetical protein C5C57_14455 [Rathayibacter sp. AY1C5]
MQIRQLTAETAAAAAIQTLGLDPEVIDLTSIEALAAALRRAASFLCPTSPGRLADAVYGAVQPLAGAGAVTRSGIGEIVDELVACGDLLELRHDNGRSARLLYLAPPSFIERHPGRFLLAGVWPFGKPLIPDDLAQTIDYEGVTRSISLDADDGPRQLRDRGLHCVLKDRWLVRPAIETPNALLDRFRGRLDTATHAGLLDDIQILDSASSVRFYAGRWRAPVASDTGDFVARRPQAYGADLWCLMRCDRGVPSRLLDWPVDDPVLPGRDEAWRYQAAVDAARGVPQQFRRRAAGDDVVFDFFSPLPGFAERYLHFVGLPLGKTTGALFSFRVPDAAADGVEIFLIDMLWMTQEEAPHGV